MVWYRIPLENHYTGHWKLLMICRNYLLLEAILWVIASLCWVKSVKILRRYCGWKHLSQIGSLNTNKTSWNCPAIICLAYWVDIYLQCLFQHNHPLTSWAVKLTLSQYIVGYGPQICTLCNADCLSLYFYRGGPYCSRHCIKRQKCTLFSDPLAGPPKRGRPPGAMTRNKPTFRNSGKIAKTMVRLACITYLVDNLHLNHLLHVPDMPSTQIQQQSSCLLVLLTISNLRLKTIRTAPYHDYDRLSKRYFGQETKRILLQI